MTDRELKRVLIAGGAILLGFFFLNAIFGAGYRAGAGGPDRYDGPGYHGGFFFPPFFLLILIGIGLVLFFRGRHWSDGDRPMGSGGRPDWRSGGPPRFLEEWHRRMHEDEQSTGAPQSTPPGGGMSGYEATTGTTASAAQAERPVTPPPPTPQAEARNVNPAPEGAGGEQSGNPPRDAAPPTTL